MEDDKIEVYESKNAAKELGVTERTVQKWAQAGRIRFEAIRKNGTPNQIRLYNGDDVRRVKDERKTGFAVATKKPAHDAKAESTALAVASFNPTRPPHLDTYNVFLSVLDQANETNKALLSQMESQAKIAAESLNSALAQIFAAQKSQREDDLRRLELERKKKSPAAMAEKEPEPPQKVNGKAKGAKA